MKKITQILYLATSGLSTGAIVGIVVGIGGTTVLVFLVILILVAVILICRKSIKGMSYV